MDHWYRTEATCAVDLLAEVVRLGRQAQEEALQVAVVGERLSLRRIGGLTNYQRVNVQHRRACRSRRGRGLDPELMQKESAASLCWHSSPVLEPS